VLDPERILHTFGALGLFAIIFAESGLLFGFFLPGDSLLFAAGLLASQGRLAVLDSPFLNLVILSAGCLIAAVVGDQVGYQFGKRVGPALFRKSDSRFFRQEYVERARNFFAHHGPKAIVLARFVPIVRTFTPILAGVGKMDYRTFFRYNLAGGVLWAVGVTSAGYGLGKTFPGIEDYLLPIAIVIILASLVPVLLEARRRRQTPDRASDDPEG